jgi:predicted nucleotidyltransferase
VGFSAKERKQAVRRQPERDDHEKALQFARTMDKELGDFLKAAVLFGSCATSRGTPVSDIDVLLIIDDVGRIVTPDVTESYRSLVLHAADRTSKRLHINTLKLSSFWEYAREGDPVVINMLREGVVLIDKGFFAPAQLLLEQGRIRPTKEAIWTYYARTSNTMRSARQHLLSACVDLYWAAIDASHAALMSVGEVPPSPEHVSDMLEHVLVRRKLLDPRFPKLMRELYHLQKAILHRELKEVSGEQYDAYWNETLRLVDALRTVVERHPPAT